MEFVSGAIRKIDYSEGDIIVLPKCEVTLDRGMCCKNTDLFCPLPVTG